jgi:hypothetical protein
MILTSDTSGVSGVNYLAVAGALVCGAAAIAAVAGRAWAVRYVFTANPTSNNARTLHNTSCSCRVSQFTAAV